MEFEKFLSCWQTDVLQHVFDYMNGQDGVYFIYASDEEGVLDFDFFIKVNNVVYTRNDIRDTSAFNGASTDYESLFNFGVDKLLELEEMFKKNEKPIPTEIRLTYDSELGAAEINYEYDLMYADDEVLLSDDVFEQWVADVKLNINMTPLFGKGRNK
ncbi:hypothetical protein EQG49_04320 [Periweissella cryptocerci]|uniref:DUF600 family protein n=1 Tax=Periweissella cryptocerci TaxID=2506420 RepID=A0A4P6YSV6_9LACO|nr:hypothetical protein [Periweissella cryptocerci]QBO35740.1 hypothetical protein EQG49_04320 [Periweissella cryptocerci]